MKTPVTQRSPYYYAVSALLMNHLPDRSNYSPLCHTLYLTLRINTSLVTSGQTHYQAVSWRLIHQSSMLQCCNAESSRDLSALRKLNNKQRQVSMFLSLLFKLLTQQPIVSVLFSLLPFSILSLLPFPHTLFLFWSILCLPKIRTLISLHSVSPMAHILHSVSHHHDIFLIIHFINLYKFWCLSSILRTWRNNGYIVGPI